MCSSNPDFAWKGLLQWDDPAVHARRSCGAVHACWQKHMLHMTSVWSLLLQVTKLSSEIMDQVLPEGVKLD